MWIEWSNRKQAPVAAELDRLLEADEVATTDMVIAEVLQGARTQELFDAWSSKLDAFHYFPAERTTWLQAAHVSFQLRRQGMTTALSDLVIAQVAIEQDLPVFATDTDFRRVPGLKLHELT